MSDIPKNEITKNSVFAAQSQSKEKSYFKVVAECEELLRDALYLNDSITVRNFSSSPHSLIIDESQQKDALIDIFFFIFLYQKLQNTNNLLQAENSTLKEENLDLQRCNQALLAEKLTLNEKVEALQVERNRLAYKLSVIEVFPELVEKAMAACGRSQSRSSSSGALQVTEEVSDEETDFDDGKDEQNEEKNQDAYNAFEGTFPIEKEVLTRISTADERRFVLELLGNLYSPKYLRLHKKSETKATHEDNLKIPIPREECVEIQDAICTGLKVKLMKNRLPAILENTLSQKFNQARPTAADKCELRRYWKKLKKGNSKKKEDEINEDED